MIQPLFAILFTDPGLDQPDVICKRFKDVDAATTWAWSVALGKTPHPHRPIQLTDDGVRRMPYGAALKITVFLASAAD